MRTQRESWQQAGSGASVEALEARTLLAGDVGLEWNAIALQPTGGPQPPAENAGAPDLRAGEIGGPVKPNRNLQVILRGEGFGVVKFRQPKDDALIVYLDVRLRGLAPNTTYILQRAVDTTVDGDCISTAWLTLGQGLQPQSITTDANGTGRAQLFRNLAAFPVGSAFDIHFRVIEEGSSEVVLTSECYQFAVQ